MAKFLRKIERNKWNCECIYCKDEVSADAITISLRTSGNTLSLWKYETEEGYQEALLAIIGALDHLVAIDVVVIEEKRLGQKQLELKQTNGLSAYTQYVRNHYDIIGLNYKTLGEVADLIVDYLKSEEEHSECKNTRLTRAKVKEELEKGISEGKIDIAKLKENVKKYFV